MTMENVLNGSSFVDSANSLIDLPSKRHQIWESSFEKPESILHHNQLFVCFIDKTRFIDCWACFVD